MYKRIIADDDCAYIIGRKTDKNLSGTKNGEVFSIRFPAPETKEKDAKKIKKHLQLFIIYAILEKL